MGFVKSLVAKGKGMVDVRNRGGIPGTASQRACLESVAVVDEVVDDRFHDFVREATGRFVRDARLRGRITEQAADLCFASSPNDHDPI